MTEIAETTELSRRLAVLEDERAVLSTLYAYGHAIDYGDEAGWVDCFLADGIFDVRMRKGSQPDRLCRGRDELAAFIAGHTRAPAMYHKHLLIEPRITVDGDRAAVDSYFLKVDAESDGPSQVVAMGRYRDQLVRSTDGRWRFRERLAEVEDM